MKTFFYVCIGIIVLGFAGYSLVMYFTSGFLKVSDSFFGHIKNEQYSMAYDLLSPEFQKQTSLQDFTTVVSQDILKNYKESNWSMRSISNGVWTLEGSIVSGSWEELPVELRFIKIDESWKIQYLDIKSVGLNTGTQTSVPSNEEILSLVNYNFSNYIKSFQAKDLSAFYNDLSEVWKQQISLAITEEKFFKPFEKDFSFEWFTPDKFVFSKEPTIDADGVLIVEWYFSNPILVKWEKSKLVLANKFIKESGKWKIIGFKFKIFDIKSPLSVPSDEEVITLVDRDISNFKEAFLAKDVDIFYRGISDLWKWEPDTKEKIDDALFKYFQDRGLDLSQFIVKNFIFTKKPHITEEQSLMIEWYYAKSVLLKWEELKLFVIGEYINENGNWKLASIEFKFPKIGDDAK